MSKKKQVDREELEKELDDLIDDDHDDDLYTYAEDKTQAVVKVMFHDELDDAHKYNKLINDLRKLPAHFKVHIYPPESGGSVSTMHVFANLLHEMAATNIIHVDRTLHSAGADFTLLGDAVVLHKFGGLMFHDFRFAFWGEAPRDIKVQIHHADKLYKDITNKVKALLTKEEIKLYENGNDLYFTNQDLIKRFRRAKIVDVYMVE